MITSAFRRTTSIGNVSRHALLASRCGAAILTLVASLLFLQAAPVSAGGGPEAAVVVVNAKSQASRRIANAYVQWRQIPAENVIHLNDVPEGYTIGVDDFREKILGPLFEQAQRRGLLPHMQYVLYSADFPTAVGVKSDANRLNQELPKIFKTTASINSLTYLYPWIMRKNAGYMQLEVNHYYRKTFEETLSKPVPGEIPTNFQQAVSAYEQGEYTKATEQFREFAAGRDMPGSLHYWLARCYAQQGQASEAEEQLQAAVAQLWSFREDTAADPAFQKYRQAEWFEKLLEDMPDTPRGGRPTTPFQAWGEWEADGLWNPKGQPSSAQAPAPYLLSTVLATPNYSFMSVEDCLQQLEQSVAADFTQPEGVFYFASGKGVRVRTRKPGFAETIRDLRRLGYKAKQFNEVLPSNRRDVLGVMIGSAKFDWPGSGSQIVPGAICENLTSHGGGVHREKPPQTLLTEFLKAGAAGSSGTVTEPYAIQAKFPHAYMQVHYARGASLAEAFYQAVHGPYQLLIVGDGLCQPFGKPPELTVAGIDEDEVLAGPVELTLEAEPDSIKQYDLYVDGRLWERVPGDTRRLTFDPSSSQLRQGGSRQGGSRKGVSLAAGFHELRLVAVANNTAGTQARKIIPFFHREQVAGLELPAPTRPYRLSERIVLELEVPSAEQIFVLHDFNQVGRAAGNQGTIQVNCASLGSGPVRLRAAAKVGDEIVFGPPVTYQVEPASNASGRSQRFR